MGITIIKYFVNAEKRPDSNERTGVGGRGLRAACSFLTARALIATVCMGYASGARRNSIVAEHIPDRGRVVERQRELGNGGDGQNDDANWRTSDGESMERMEKQSRHATEIRSAKQSSWPTTVPQPA